MNNIKYSDEDFNSTEEDSEIINESVVNPKDLEKYARQVCKDVQVKI